MLKTEETVKISKYNNLIGKQSNNIHIDNQETKG